MKKQKINRLTLIAGMAIIVIAFSACGSTKKAVQTPNDEDVVVTYCSGPEYFSNAEHVRANDVGESQDQSVSKKKAYTNARTAMAASLQTLVKTVNENYVESSEYNNKEEVLEKFQSLTYEVIIQELDNTGTLCEKVTKTSNNKYKTYVAIELAGDELTSACGSKLSQDEKLKIDFDLDRYKKTFEKQMKQYEENR